tara:strand:+ start:3256 stop:3624 length:369 start_codon:yes stop_codon:yes gene_type:complete
MSKLLQTRLPVSMNTEITSDIFNRLVRVLEINLGSFDSDNTRQINTPDRDKSFFSPGAVIWNTTNDVLQVYTGYEWLDVSTPTNPQGFQAKTKLGLVSVTTNGNVSVSVTLTAGWDNETYYT